MSPFADAMNNPVTHPPEPSPIMLVRKLVLLTLIMIVTALGVVILLHHMRVFSLLPAFLLSDAVMGLIAGFSARWILRRQSIFLRITSSVIFVVCGLELLGWFTSWQFGLASLRGDHIRANWFSLVQLILAGGIAILPLYAWNHFVRPVAPVATPPAAPKTPRQRKRLKKSPRPAAAAAVTEPALSLQVSSTKVAVTELSGKPKRKRTTQHKPQLHLSPEEEHRCPYCLELIIPDDPRGTVECKICHTLHHADCWAITGACQVPHYTA